MAALFSFPGCNLAGQASVIEAASSPWLACADEWRHKPIAGESPDKRLTEFASPMQRKPMYNNRGHFSTRTASSNGGKKQAPGYMSVAGMRVRSLYFYIGVALAVVVAGWFLWRLLNTAITTHFVMVAGVLLLVGNIREFLSRSTIYVQPDNSITLMNSLVGGALVCTWLASILTSFLWIPAVLLLGGAVPLVVSRTAAYSVYVQTAKRVGSGVRRSVGRF